VRFINAFQLGGFVPQGLKPAFFQALNGTAKAVPYPKPIYETRSSNSKEATQWEGNRLSNFVIPLLEQKGRTSDKIRCPALLANCQTSRAIVYCDERLDSVGRHSPISAA